ncbi:MAG: ATP-dependent zinc protease [Gammaproteobacteria bacterium]|nr:ATP-dependent zinc protease [Gammaproteobacteria bacterium]
MRTAAGLALLATLLGSLPGNALARTTPDETPAVIGWVEQVTLTESALSLQAKVDTGADVSSVHTDSLRYFSRDGSPWVEFMLRADDGRSRQMQQPVVRFASIKLKTTGVQRRPVVRLGVCVGDRYRVTEFNLSQRGAFTYPVLLGRSFLAGHYLVDPAAKYRQAPRCN